MKVFNVSDLDVSKFVYSEPKTNAMGGQSVYISANEHGDKIVLQTPKCAVPFGLNTFEPPKGGDKKYSVDLSLRGNSPPMQNFTKLIQDFDDHNANVAVQQCQSWFKKHLDESVIDELYKSTLKTQKNHAPLMKVKLPSRNDEFLGDIFDKNKNKIDMSAITPGCTVQAIVECVGMYFIAREFGVTWKIIQLKVYPPNKLIGYAFLDDEPDEDVEPVK